MFRKHTTSPASDTGDVLACLLMFQAAMAIYSSGEKEESTEIGGGKNKNTLLEYAL